MNGHNQPSSFHLGQTARHTCWASKVKKPSWPRSFEFGLRVRLGPLACPPWSWAGKAVVRSNSASQMLENRSSSAWFDLAATHFIRSDLAMHAVQDASYLDSERKLSEGTQIPAKGYRLGQKGYRLPAKGHLLKSTPCGSCQTKVHCFLVRSQTRSFCSRLLARARS